MKNIHILPTDKPSRLGQVHEKLSFFKDRTWDNTENWRCKNIYITSDEEIKVRDYIIELDGNEVFRSKGVMGKNNWCKKVILTTDQDLIKDGVQAIDDTFLEWFVKNPSCEWVEVIYDKDAFPYGVETAKGYGWYKIIIPQEEPKQETLEEAAEKQWGKLAIINDRAAVIAFKAGAKWQAERMYSEEDIREAFIAGGNSCMKKDDVYGSLYDAYMENWFEQFKKK